MKLLRDYAINSRRNSMPVSHRDGRYSSQGRESLVGDGGLAKDDPLFDEWQAAIRENRKQRDIEDGIEVDEQK